MPMALKQLEVGIYCIHVWDTSTYDDALQIQQHYLKVEANYHESNAIIIIDRQANAEVNLSFAQIRKLIANLNHRNIHYLHIDVSNAARLLVFTINKITLINMELVPNRQAAIQRARVILSGSFLP